MSPLPTKRGGRDTAESCEISRIVSLPLVDDLDPEAVEAFSRQEVQAGPFQEGFRLFPEQAAAVLAYDLFDGLFGPIPVGRGKTLISLMIADRAFVHGRSKRSMLFMPPQVYSQLVNKDIAWARQKVGLSVPLHLMGGRTLRDRRRIAGSGMLGCYILPYSLLSSQDTEAMLSGDHDKPPPDKPAIDGIRPDLLILDEAHKVKNFKAARTGRLMRYVKDHNPRGCVLSGTITTKSIRDYSHLISWALGENSPLPQDNVLANNWSYVLDPEKPGQQDNPREASSTGPLVPLLHWAQEKFPDEDLPDGMPGLRAAYRLRLTSAPGVVSSNDTDIGVSLIIKNEPVKDHKESDGWKRLAELMKQVDELWLSPSGDEIEFGIHKWRYQYELTTGFYHKQRWPEIEELTARGLSTTEAEVYLERAIEHHEAHQEYARCLRQWFKDGCGGPGLDTPMLVGRSMYTDGAKDVGKDLYMTWREMKDLEFEGMPERISEPVRICDYKIAHAVDWAKSLKTGGLVWVHHDDPGKWLVERLEAADVPTLWCPSESRRKGSNDLIADPANADKVCVASMSAHDTGKNLQHFREQFFLQLPRQADRLEQVLGRTHRTGQEADELVPVTANTTEFDHQNLWACLIEALYIHQTTGTRQKAVYASWDPLPRRFPEDFLRERGFVDLPKLDAETRRKLEEKFACPTT